MEQSGAATGNSTGGTKETLNQLMTEVYEDRVEELALGLGRPVDQVTSWLDGSEEPDEDAVEKINALAATRLGEDGDRTPPAAAHSDRDIEQRI